MLNYASTFILSTRKFWVFNANQRKITKEHNLNWLQMITSNLYVIHTVEYVTSMLDTLLMRRNVTGTGELVFDCYWANLSKLRAQ